jgi:hypothetical protein
MCLKLTARRSLAGCAGNGNGSDRINALLRIAPALKIYPPCPGLIHPPHRLHEHIFDILETDMKKKSEPDPRAKTKQGWTLSAFIAYALEALAAVNRKKAGENERPMPDRDRERS